jgi:hypothetical protein
MGTFNHNKKRNSGLVYEFLVRRLSRAMIDQNNPIYQKTLGIVHKYYATGAPISEERELFDVVKNTRGVSENAARRILGEIQRAAKYMDAKRIDIKKSNLIKEINHGFGQNFWDEHRVPDYRLYATIQMIIDAARSAQRLTESVQSIQLEEGLVRYMTSVTEFAVAPPPNQDIDQLVMAMTAKKFQEKYSHSLNPNQKVLLEKFLRFQVAGDEKRLFEHINSEHTRITKALESEMISKEASEDPIMKEKLTEAYLRFTEGGHRTLDEEVERLMLYQKLVEEIDSDE